MKIVFRLNYHSTPGQSLWLKYSTVLDEKGVRFDQIVPLHWLNDGQWETRVNMRGAGRFRLEYNYQLRQVNGVELDEWHAPRTAGVDLDSQDALLLLDSWCSAGTVDYAFETNAFLAVLPARGPFQELPMPENANHSFQLRMAAVPAGQVPCLLGSVSEIGNWGWFSAIPLVETAPNVWRKNLYLPVDWGIEYKYGLFDLKLKCVVGMELGENRRISARALAARQWTKVEDECYRRDHGHLFRGAGVAMPVFSLRSEDSLGVGEFADLKPFGDWAHSVGLKLIQILPVNDTTSTHEWTDSYPYSAISVFALHPLYLRIDDLNYAMPSAFKQELATAREKLNPLEKVDYEAVMRVKTKLTRKIFDKYRAAITASTAFKDFLAENGEWVIPYAVFCLKRDHYGTADFSHWEEWAVFDREKVEALAAPAHADWPEIFYHIWLQYELDLQLADAVHHLHEHGLALKGDLPIGIDRQSVDAWSAPHLFKMDAQAGAPPDDFAVKGQNWGFPTYNWEVMRQDDYAWWRSRFEHLSHHFDAYRIDHILGFFRIWQVPTGHVEGIMGHFDPAVPIHIDEIRKRGIDFEYNRFCRPYIRWYLLRERFGDAVEYVKGRFLHDCGNGYFQLTEQVATQRRIVDFFAENPHDDFARLAWYALSSTDVDAGDAFLSGSRRRHPLAGRGTLQRLLLPPSGGFLAGLRLRKTPRDAQGQPDAALRRGPRHGARLRAGGDEGTRHPVTGNPAHAQDPRDRIFQSGAGSLHECGESLHPRHVHPARVVEGRQPHDGKIRLGDVRHLVPRVRAIRRTDYPDHRPTPAIPGDVGGFPAPGSAGDGRIHPSPAAGRGADQRPGDQSVLLALPDAPRNRRPGGLGRLQPQTAAPA